MRVIKPNWVEHAAGEKQTKSPIYSISVHPDGTRLATGGQDNKVKIWSTLPILDPEAAENAANHKLLCTMSAHTVLTVRWAHHGRHLASGSDDSVLLIWDIDPAGGGRVFGSEEVNVENWKALRRLVGHVADVVDCAWSRDDTMLASVGLDSKIIIWDAANNFERMRTIDAHQGFVKGVTWDPVGNYLATQSDDKTVRIWDTDKWECVEKVSQPFEMSPQSTFFRRLSWSPDGAFIAASNAMNGPVFVAAVIEREGWTADISFVGHENTIQVAAFNPRLFFRAEDEPSRVNASCMVALGADDFTISVWRNTLHKPLAVIKDIFARQILDLCWANDGLTLYGCSADGTVCAMQFRKEEFPELAGPEMTPKILDEYGYKPARRRKALTLPSATAFSMPASGGQEHVNVLVPRKGKPKARRINLSGTMSGGSMTNGGSAAMTSMGSSGGGGGRPPLQRPSQAEPSRPPLQRPDSDSNRTGAMDAFARAAEDEPLSFGSGSAATARMFDNARSLFEHGSPRSVGKRKASMDDDDSGRTPKGRSLGASRTLAPVQALRAPLVSLAGSSGGGGGPAILLPVPSIQNVLRTQQEDGNGVLTAENGGDEVGSTNTVTFSSGGKDLWIDFVPSPVLAIAATSSLAAAACEDGMVRVYSGAGRLVSTVKLPAPVTELAGAGDMLMIITADCFVRVIDVKRGKVVVAPSSIAHLLSAPSTSSQAGKTLEVQNAMIRPNGCPVVITSEPAAWAYDPDMGEWTQIASPWWSASPLVASEGRTRNGRSPPSGVLLEIEQRVSTMERRDPPENEPQWWKESMSTAHLETRLRAARLLGSKDEYRHWLKEYARFLGEENFRERAEELVGELMGPVYYYNGKPDWNPRLLGVPKHDFAKDVLGMLKHSVSLAAFANEKMQQLKSMQNEASRWSADD